MIAAIVAVGILAFGPELPAQTQPLSEQNFQVRTGHDLLELCDPPAGDPYARDAIHMCHGVVLGAYGVHQAVAGRLGRVVCPPANVTRADGVRVFVSWARAHPENLNEPAIDALFRAWAASYPCR
jgi:hypothetical protein